MHGSCAEDSAASNRQISKDTNAGNDIDGTEGTPELNGKPGIFPILHRLHLLNHVPGVVAPLAEINDLEFRTSSGILLHENPTRPAACGPKSITLSSSPVSASLITTFAMLVA